MKWYLTGLREPCLSVSQIYNVFSHTFFNLVRPGKELEKKLWKKFEKPKIVRINGLNKPICLPQDGIRNIHSKRYLQRVLKGKKIKNCFSLFSVINSLRKTRAILYWHARTYFPQTPCTFNEYGCDGGMGRDEFCCIDHPDSRYYFCPEIG